MQNLDVAFFSALTFVPFCHLSSPLEGTELEKDISEVPMCVSGGGKEGVWNEMRVGVVR